MKYMKRRIITYAVAPAVLGFGLLGAGVASAHGLFGGISALSSDQIAARQVGIFEHEAELLGISVDEVKVGWAQGKTIKEIAADHHITADQLKINMQKVQQDQMKKQLQALVDKGVVTQQQADARLTAMQSRLAAGKGHHLGRGFGRRGMGHEGESF